MFSSTYTAWRLLFYLATATCIFGQAKPGPDMLIFVDGEKLIGQLKSATDSKVVFKSDMAGEVTVEWSKIQELRTGNKFAAIPKDVTLRNSEDAAKVAQGTLEMTNQKLEVSTAPSAAPQTMPVGSISNVVEEASFERALHHQGFLEGWKGSAGLGVSITESTQNNQAFNSNFFVSRADPSEGWLRIRDRTSLDFNSSYAKITQAGSPSISFSAYQANALRDHYFSPRLFIFAGASWEHNSAQGLDLMQAYGGGIGVVVFKGERSELDARAGLGYMRQQFADPTLDKNIIGSRFNESYSRTFGHGITFNEMAGIRPAWNYPKAYFTGFTASLTVPVYHRLGLALSSFDSYVNDPPPGFKKNSFQLTIGVNYAIK